VQSSSSDSSQGGAQAKDSSQSAGGIVAGDSVYVLYFCPPDIAKTAGEGSAAAVAYTKETRKAPSNTIWEVVAFRNALRKEGITQYVKVPLTAENAALARKYNVPPTLCSLVFCAPRGEAIATYAGPDCTQTAVLKFLASFKDYYAAWQKVHPPKVAGK
jgi:hypothetical protein